jgi:hypothetical protein
MVENAKQPTIGEFLLRVKNLPNPATIQPLFAVISQDFSQSHINVHLKRLPTPFVVFGSLQDPCYPTSLLSTIQTTN